MRLWVELFLAKNWKTCTWLLSTGAALFIAYSEGQLSVQQQWDTSKALQRDEVAVVEAAQAQETVRTVTEYVDRVKTVTVKGDTIIKEVPLYVTKEDDDRCVVNDGFVVLWNAANRNEVPGTAPDPDGGASSPVGDGARRAP